MSFGKVLLQIFILVPASTPPRQALMPGMTWMSRIIGMDQMTRMHQSGSKARNANDSWHKWADSLLLGAREIGRCRPLEERIDSKSSEGEACAIWRGGDGQGAAGGQHVAGHEGEQAALRASAAKQRWRWNRAKRPAVFGEARAGW